MWPGTADATLYDNFAPAPGWSRAVAFAPDDAPLRHGILLDARAIDWNSPLVADLDANPDNGNEVAIADPSGMLRVFGGDGTLWWQALVAAEPCDFEALGSGFMPAVAPIYGDGVPYLVVGYGGFQSTKCDGGVTAFQASTGLVAWRFSTRAWEQTEAYPHEAHHGVMTTPAIADTDGDGRMEIAFGGLDRNFYLLNADGKVRWYYHAADTIWSSPVFAQIDDDPQLEVVTASDVSFGGDAGGGYVQAFDTTARWPIRIEFDTGFIWRTPNLDQAPYSSPAVGDVLPEEPGDELVIGSGWFFPPSGGECRGKWVKIFRLRDGAELQTLAMPPGGSCTASSPALADIDDDGRLEVVIGTGNPTDTSGDARSRIVAWDPEVSTPKWVTIPYDPIWPPGDPAGNHAAVFFRSPTIADLDGNGSLEVAFANFWSVVVLAGSDGMPLTCQHSQCGSQQSLFAWGMLTATPAIGDLDGDGAPEVVIGGMHVNSPAGAGYGVGERALVYAWSGFTAALGSRPGKQPDYAAPWPTFRGRPDARATGSGGPVTDVCLSLADPSVARLRCRLAQLRATLPCVMAESVAKVVHRGDRAADLPEARVGSPWGRRCFRRASRLFRRAQRLAGRRMSPECADPLRTGLDEIVALANALASIRGVR